MRCTNKAKYKCNNAASILVTEKVKVIIQDSQKKLKSLFLDEADPRVYDIRNNDIKSFRQHKFPGTDLDVYNEEIEKSELVKRTLRQRQITCKSLRKVQCELVLITETLCGNLKFHFEIY